MTLFFETAFPFKSVAAIGTVKEKGTSIAQDKSSIPIYFLFLQEIISRVERKTNVSDDCFSPNLISSPWRRSEDYNISFCKQWKFRCHCSYEQWHLNLHCLQRGPSCP